MDFLNALLPLEHPIMELSFRNAEQLGEGVDERKAIYDIYCQDSQGSYFIVEMQKAKQNFFKDRTIFYTTFPIRDQAEPSVVGEVTSRTNEDSIAKGPWNFELQAVYCIGVLDFVFEEDKVIWTGFMRSNSRLATTKSSTTSTRSTSSRCPSSTKPRVS